MPRRDQDKMGSLKRAVDVAIVGENISDLAAFTLEKYECTQNSPLSSAVRQEGDAKIKDVLWQRVEALKTRRMQILADMFTLAETTLEAVITSGK